MLPIDPEKMLVEAIDKAKLCFQIGDLEYGRDILEQVLRCAPEHQQAIQLLGALFHKTRQYAEAIPLFEQAIALDRENADNYNNLALCLTSLGRHDEGIEQLNTALRLAPEDHRFHSNIALQYRAKRMYDRAVDHLNEAIKIDPSDTQVWSNLGGVYGEMHDLKMAESCYRTAIGIDPNMASAHVDLAYTLHLKGNYEEAWKEYEHRFDFFHNLLPYKWKYDPAKRWTDPSQGMTDKTIMIYCEQGLGDALNFVRYIAELKYKFDCKVILHCWDSMKTLFEANPQLKIDEIYTTPIVMMTPENTPEYDHHASIMSLPYLLGMSEPIGDDYLIAPEKADLGFKDHIKIGICWAGSPQHPNDSIRSCPLKHFKALEDAHPKVKLFSLQQHTAPRKYAFHEKVVDYTEGVVTKITDLSEFMTDFAKTAGLLEDLDIIVTVDTALMHLSAAMARPTFGLLAYNPDWRWGLEGERTPWYDNLTLIRQDHPGDWEGVFKRLVEHIKTNDLLQNQR